MADQDIRDFLTALSAAGVRFVVVGAYALAAHGRVRATGDIDVLIEASPTNATRLEAAIREFAGTSLEYFQVSVAELSRPGVGFYMGVEPDRIDILTRIDGVSFQRAWNGRAPATIVGVDVGVLDLDALLAAKRASSRRRAPGSMKAAQDQADLAWLEEAKRARAGRTQGRS